jgi:hypothetical protein
MIPLLVRERAGKSLKGNRVYCPQLGIIAPLPERERLGESVKKKGGVIGRERSGRPSAKGRYVRRRWFSVSNGSGQ